jgi:hypothetical protein
LKIIGGLDLEPKKHCPTFLPLIRQEWEWRREITDIR